MAYVTCDVNSFRLVGLKSVSGYRGPLETHQDVNWKRNTQRIN